MMNLSPAGQKCHMFWLKLIPSSHPFDCLRSGILLSPNNVMMLWYASRLKLDDLTRMVITMDDIKKSLLPILDSIQQQHDRYCKN